MNPPLETATSRDVLLRAARQAAPILRRVSALPEIVECRRMMGTPDYVMLIAVADLADYEKLYADKLSVLPGIATIRSDPISR